jgi:2-keto-4-pentenoate hydratase/2-oxohepta-3-ene-1,7-dioic acid hydratase in catechol pathway
MKLLNFRDGSGLKLGVKTDKGVIYVHAAAMSLLAQGVPTDLNAVIRGGPDALAALRGFVAMASERAIESSSWLLHEEDLTYGPGVPNPGKILCVGLNYLQHAQESGMEPPKHPVLFSKFNNAIAASGDDIPVSDVVTQMDYEAELVVVIGRRAKNVSEAEALDYVFGYTNGNDISDRALQFVSGQWLLGKSLDRFLPVGPYLVTTDDIPDPQNLPVKCWLNGELRQDSNTADMIFTVAQIVSYASKHMTLEPGDIISTGTPQGVIMGMDPKNWMKPGDTMVVEVGDMGRLENTIT